MSLCACCGLDLPAGARHPDKGSCVEALRARLEARCPKCGGAIGCMKCTVKRAARREIGKHAPGAAQVLRILGEVLKPEAEEGA